jgi:toxin ParE1/3/4
MSAHRRRIELARRARRDLQGIRLYGLAQWGEERANAYHDALTKGFAMLQDFPELGVARDDLRPGLRSLQVEQHRILYRIRGETIRVLRIIHGRQDIEREFDR